MGPHQDCEQFSGRCAQAVRAKLFQGNSVKGNIVVPRLLVPHSLSMKLWGHLVRPGGFLA